MPTIHHGDCIETMNAMPPESVDAIVTDPPYGLGFMGRKWDSLPPSLEWAEACYRVLKPGGHIAAFGGTRTWHRLAVAIEDAGFEMRDSLAWLYGSGFPKSHDVSKGIDKLDASDERRGRALEFTAFIRESGLTARRIDDLTGTNMGDHFTTSASQPRVATAELFDKLRPHLPDVPERIEEMVRQRTVESENFKRREVTGHHKAGNPIGVYEFKHGGGKGRTANERRDMPATSDAERWQGWGTALKPAFEPIVLARKPLAEKTVARNVLEHGTGAINVDACRIGTTVETWPATRSYGGDPSEVAFTKTAGGVQRAQSTGSAPSGRWPANVLLDHHAAAWVDEQSGHQKDGVAVNRNKNPDIERPHTVYGGGWMNGDRPDVTYGGGGGASRFFYTAKAPKRERPTYTRPVLRLRDNLTPAQADHVRARLQEAGISLD